MLNEYLLRPECLGVTAKGGDAVPVQSDTLLVDQIVTNGEEVPNERALRNVQALACRLSWLADQNASQYHPPAIPGLTQVPEEPGVVQVTADPAS